MLSKLVEYSFFYNIIYKIDPYQNKDLLLLHKILMTNWISQLSFNRVFLHQKNFGKSSFFPNKKKFHHSLKAQSFAKITIHRIKSSKVMIFDRVSSFLSHSQARTTITTEKKSCVSVFLRDFASTFFHNIFFIIYVIFPRNRGPSPRGIRTFGIPSLIHRVPTFFLRSPTLARGHGTADTIVLIFYLNVCKC